MAALPRATVSPSPSISYSKRRPLALSERRLAANRRNAARSTGPRTAKGKARVARNAIKHGFFADPARWNAQQQREFTELFVALREDFQPQNEREQDCVIIADSYMRMAAMLRYENFATLKYHQERECDLEARIAAADAAEAARLRAHREELRRAGLWRPTIPGPRELKAIIRYEGRLDRTIRDAVAELENLQKQTHFVEQSRGIFDFANVGRRATSSGSMGSAPRPSQAPIPVGKGHPSNEKSANEKSAKTNPLNPAFTGNRHERRRAKALTRRRTKPFEDACPLPVCRERQCRGGLPRCVVYATKSIAMTEMSHI